MSPTAACAAPTQVIDSMAPVIEPVAPSLAVAYAVHAVTEYASTSLAAACAAPTPRIEHASRTHAVTYAASALVIKSTSSSPARCSAYSCERIHGIITCGTSSSDRERVIFTCRTVTAPTPLSEHVCVIIC